MYTGEPGPGDDIAMVRAVTLREQCFRLFHLTTIPASDCQDR